ncbi:TRAP transporter substrate-binding protein [Desulfatirhabdium butyrativorans]|uniref:TRAP transporter substrate-binding protein n=1 Tax=Desulfatirhabdium butyrativorans TaxID=340467 RepID=UPI00042409FF|nr:TRAP transporter substrate-binding protein [Desulfatirhabdium butyrativorans]
MRRNLMTLAWSCLFSFGLMWMPLIQSATAATIELAYANFFPPMHEQGKLAEAWAKEVEARTNGKVKITYYGGGGLLNGPQIYDGVLKGIADIGMSVFGYSRGVFPAMEVIDLPNGYPDGKTATRVINAFYQKFKPEELNKVKVLYLHAHGPGILHSKKEINRLEDLKGLKIRSYGFNADMVTALGAVPVSLPISGVYEALQKGVADATFVGSEALKGWKQAEVIKYTIGCYGIGYSAGQYVVMNLDRWKSLPKDVQDVFEQVSAEWIPKHGAAWDQSDKEGLEYSLSLGNKFIRLSAEEDARWVAAVEPVTQGYIEAMNKKGLPGKQYVDFVREEVKKGAK